MNKNQDNISIKDELKVLTKRIEDVKRDNWDLSDETIEAYLIGKNKGEEDFVSSVIKFYVEKLNIVQDSVESIYSELNKNGVKCKKAHLKINGLDFISIFVIDDKDFHNLEKKKLCYSVSKKYGSKINDNEILVSFRFTCEENLDVENLKLNGYNVSFG